MRTPGSSVADDFFRSSLVLDSDRGARVSTASAVSWLRERERSMSLRVERIPFSGMDAWHFTRDPLLRLVHRTGRFFTVEGARFRAPDRSWDQPIFDQPEVGLLGFLVTTLNGVLHFLVQAKWEPGSSAPQFSPTVQATHSNYTRVHGGRSQPYLERFLDAPAGSAIFDALMPELGSHFLRKWNRNVVVEVDDPAFSVGAGFLWLTLGQLKTLLQRDHLVHMDTRSLIACLLLGGDHAADLVDAFAPDDSLATAVARSAGHKSDIEGLKAWLKGIERAAPVAREPRGLDELDRWEILADAIRPLDAQERACSIIAVSVEADQREVKSWTQPMIMPEAPGFLGLLCQRASGVLSMLVQARTEPGYEGAAQLFPTVIAEPRETSPLAAFFSEPAPGRVLCDARSSVEGGRFFQNENRLVIVEAPEGLPIEIPPNHRWLTLGELEQLGVLGRVSMELRDLLASLPVVGV